MTTPSHPLDCSCALHRPHVPKGCESCGAEPATLDLYAGRRCIDHPPAFDPATAVALLLRGGPGAAWSYVRCAP